MYDILRQGRSVAKGHCVRPFLWYSLAQQHGPTQSHGRKYYCWHWSLIRTRWQIRRPEREKYKEDNKRDEQIKRLAATSILKIENMVVQLDALRCNANFTAVSAVVAAPIKDAHDTFSAWLLACKACIDGDVTERSSGI